MKYLKIYLLFKKCKNFVIKIVRILVMRVMRMWVNVNGRVFGVVLLKYCFRVLILLLL